VAKSRDWTDYLLWGLVVYALYRIMSFGRGVTEGVRGGLEGFFGGVAGWFYPGEIQTLAVMDAWYVEYLKGQDLIDQDYNGVVPPEYSAQFVDWMNNTLEGEILEPEDVISFGQVAALWAWLNDKYGHDYPLPSEWDR